MSAGAESARVLPLRPPELGWLVPSATILDPVTSVNPRRVVLRLGTDQPGSLRLTQSATTIYAGAARPDNVSGVAHEQENSPVPWQTCSVAGEYPVGCGLSFYVSGDSAAASVRCSTGTTYGYVYLPNVGTVFALGVSLSCDRITGGDSVRGVLDCSWAPDPRTSWVSRAPVYRESSKFCITGARGTRVDLS